VIYEGKDISQEVKESAEVCVIGSGAGGAVAAKELAEAGHSVVLLEEGGNYTTKDFSRSLVQTFSRLYRDGGTTVALGRPPVAFPIGRCLGGTTTINSGTCFRTPDKILRRWRREFGIEGIEPEQMRPYFERVEKIINVTPVNSGNMGKNGEIVLRGAKKLGYSSGPLLRNVKDCRGCGVCVMGCPSGAKQPTSVNYVPMAVEHGARVYCDARAEKILVKSGVACGVEGHILERETNKAKHKFSVMAKVVVLSAGAIHSPLLLLRNKLANSSGQVGKNLRLHPGLGVSALMDEEVNGWLGVPQSVYVDEFIDEGIMLEGAFVIPPICAAQLPYSGEKAKDLMFHYKNIALFGTMVFDETRGRVRPGVLGRGLITYNMIREDVKKATRGIAYDAEIFFAAGAKKVFPYIPWMPEMTSVKQVHEILRRGLKPSELKTMAFHPMGTCTMGIDRRYAVVDPYSESFDVKNLFVCDASIFPTCLGVNPMVSIMAFANRSADYIHEMKLS
jgi:choline dehydrogenase-like flavoprotein